jgi:two-component system sensor histidine kinase KdpD
MGYAAGVGKTYRMLEDAQALKNLGTDVVIGYFEPHGRQDTIEKTEGLQIIPRA